MNRLWTCDRYYACQIVSLSFVGLYKHIHMYWTHYGINQALTLILWREKMFDTIGAELPCDVSHSCISCWVFERFPPFYTRWSFAKYKQSLLSLNNVYVFSTCVKVYRFIWQFQNRKLQPTIWHDHKYFKDVEDTVWTVYELILKPSLNFYFGCLNVKCNAYLRNQQSFYVVVGLFFHLRKVTLKKKKSVCCT